MVDNIRIYSIEVMLMGTPKEPSNMDDKKLDEQLSVLWGLFDKLTEDIPVDEEVAASEELEQHEEE